MKTTRRGVYSGFLAFTLGMSFLAVNAEDLQPRPSQGVVRLSNSILNLEIEQHGGQLVNLRLAGHDLNPLSWAKTPETMPRGAHKDAVYKGHFLCMGRTGRPSEGEMKAGVPMRGEQTGILWTILKQDAGSVEMECAAPLDALKVRRRLEMDESAACFFVTEEFENTGALGRPHNVLQHATIGPPFLSEATLINSNAKQGFSNKHARPDPHQFEYEFPVARLDGAGNRSTDLRLSSDPVNYLSQHIFDPSEEYGWITAYDPASGLVLGYVWKLRDYPWINIWNKAIDGKLAAKGLEFGTAGVEGTYRQLLETDTRFHGVPSWEYIDAGEVIEKSYICFLMDIGKDAGNPFVRVEGDQLLLNGETAIPNALNILR